MTLDTVAEQRFEHNRGRASLPGSRNRRLLLAAVLGSVIIHLLPIGLFVLLPGADPRKAGPENRGEVELLMVEQKGGAPSQAAQPSDSPAKPEPAKPDARSAAKETQQTDIPPAEKTDAPLPVTDDAGEAVPLPHSPGKAEAPPAPPAPEAPLNPPPAARAPVFDFAGTDSDTNAHIISGNILPAMPDDRFRNRPPPYPLDAAMRGEAGAVLVIIHVSAYGVATGADVAESSGSASLDRAAVAAVRKWHFHPAMKEGLAVPFDMPFRFVFSTD
jgi:protein TonB